MPRPLLALCSVAAEARPLLALADSVRPLDVNSVTGWTGTIGGRDFWCVATGMGKVNAAHAATVSLTVASFAGMIGFGVGGAYPGSGLAVGEVAIATAEEYGDEGSLTPTGWISTEGIGIPLVERGDQKIFNRFELEKGLAEMAAHAGANAGLRVTQGPFLTLSCCSGTDQAAAEMERRFGAICESMEGAAWAHIAALHDVPFVEIRGISNRVENRNPTAWKIPAAAEAAARAVAATLAAWPEHVEHS